MRLRKYIKAFFFLKTQQFKQHVNKDLWQTTIATATRTWKNNRSNDQNNSSARAYGATLKAGTVEWRNGGK